MRIRLLAITTALTTLAATTMAGAAAIAVVAPQAGPYALLGMQVFDGARVAAEAAGHTVLELDESCEPGGSADLVERMIEGEAIAAVGFLCTETLSDLLPQLSQADIPAITIGVRSRILMEDALREGWPLYRLAPVEGDEAERIGAVVLERWKAEAIAIIDDGTIYGRELASAVRQSIEAAGLSPVFVDTYRPGQEQQIALVRRLHKAGATHVVVGGDRNDVAVIARDAATENIPLALLGGDTMRAADRPIPLTQGVMAVAVADHAALPPATAAAVTLQAENIALEGYVMPAYAAVQVIAEAASRDDAGNLSALLSGPTFQTVIGPVAFDDGHELSDNPLRLQEWRSGRFVAADIPTE